MIGTRSANAFSIRVLVVPDDWHMCNHETHIDNTRTLQKFNQWSENSLCVLWQL